MTYNVSPSQVRFRALIPLMGKEYFFPDPPLCGGKMSPVLCESDDDEDEPDKCLASKIDFDVRTLRDVADYSDEIKNSNIPNIVVTSNFDVVSFLSTDKRDYLDINDSSGRRFEVAQLRDKRWVMICCFFCPSYSISSESLDLRAVSSICSDLYDWLGDSFALVLVFKMRRDFQADKLAFTHMLSGFPSSCLVVPFWDSLSRDSICHSLGLTSFARGMFLDGRNVIWHKDLFHFRMTGVDAFPFTDYDLRRINNDRLDGSWNCQSLEELLRCSPSMVIGKNPGGGDWFKMTSIEQLQQKLVGVYLCLNGNFIPLLHQIYESCHAINKEFEIVVVYFPFSVSYSDPHSFQKLVDCALEKRKISWWILPYKRCVSLRLWRLCNSPIEDKLIMVGKGFADPHGAYVIQKFGMRSYPFSREVMFQKETERISNVTLPSLLVYGERDYLVRKHSILEDKVPVASLVGKNIFIVFDCIGEGFNNIVYGPLRDYYSAIKAKDPEFEIVYVGSHGTSSASSTVMPCLTCPYDIHHFDLVSKILFAEGINQSTLVAFKKDGLIGSIQAHKLLCSQGIEAYPFDGSGLKQEVINEFQSRYHKLPLGDL